MKSRDLGAALKNAHRSTSALLTLTIGLWSAQYASLTVRTFAQKQIGPFFVYLSIDRVITCTLGGVLCLVMAAVLARFGRSSLRRQIGVAGLCALIASLIWSVANNFVLSTTSWLVTGKGYSMGSDFLLNVLSLIWLFIAWAGIWLAITYNNRLVDTELLAANAQNQMLRYQLNPHFMFNTLSALATFISEKDAAKAERVVLSLSKFLRASLERSPQERVPVSDEIAVQQEYLNIERARFEDRLQVTVHVTPEAAGVLVPSLILQPLVENAIKYGVGPSSEPVTVEIEARCVSGRLLLSVRNDGCSGNLGTARPTLGVGLTNVRRRLALMHGDAARLTVGPKSGGGFEATIDFPAEY